MRAPAPQPSRAPGAIGQVAGSLPIDPIRPLGLSFALIDVSHGSTVNDQPGLFARDELFDSIRPGDVEHPGRRRDHPPIGKCAAQRSAEQTVTSADDDLGSHARARLTGSACRLARRKAMSSEVEGTRATGPVGSTPRAAKARL